MLYPVIDAIGSNPFVSIAMATLALGVLCGPSAAGVGGLAMLLQELNDNFWDYLKKAKGWLGSGAQKMADGGAAVAKKVLIPIAEMISKAAGVLVNSLIDNVHGAVKQLIAGGQNITDQILDFLKQYFLYMLLAFVAYRYLR